MNGFKMKYHPKELEKQKTAGEAHLQSRLKAFEELLSSGWFSKNPLEMQNQDDIVKTMDAATILMEGGSEYDLSVLDRKQVRDDVVSKPGVSQQKRVSSQESSKKSMDFASEKLTPEQMQLQEQAQKYKKMRMSKGQEDDDDDGKESPLDESLDSEELTEDVKDGEDKYGGTEHKEEEEGEDGEGEEKSEEEGEGEGTEHQSPRPLHLTRSVYVKKVPPSINTEDIEQVCRTIPGYLRLAFSEPVPEKDYERRCWVTFEHTTNIREVIARITSNAIKGQTLECSTNRDLPRRVKLGSKASYMRRAVVNDIKLAKKMIEYFDNKAGLWKEEPVSMEPSDDQSDSDQIHRINPVLENLPVLEEEDIEGTGEVGDRGEDEEEGMIGVNPADRKEAGAQLLQSLDLMLWYLRIVHSVDFYGNSSVPSEDLMPHRCGIITARNSKGSHHMHQDEVDEYILSMEKNLEVLMKETPSLKPEEVEKLGNKTYDVEVEKFIEKNTEKISDEKYHCPLSGKKFKAPEFVRKHIFNKHMEKVEAVKLEVDSFNYYLKDPERPMPETITSTVSTPTGLGGGLGRGLQSPPEMMGWMQPPPMFGQGMFPPFGGPGMMGGGRGGRPGRGGGRGRGSSRSAVSYRDLDNPAEMDF
jgi:hypothetical protein